MPEPRTVEAAPDAAPSRRRWVILLVVLVLLGVAAVFLLPDFFYARSHESTDDAFLDADVVQIAPKVGGQVLRVLVKDNQVVRKGDLLARIDPSDYQVAYNSAEATLQQALEREKSNRITVGLTQVNTGATVEQATSGVQQARGAAEAAQAGVATAQSQVQSAEDAVQAAQARVTQAEDQVRLAQRDVQTQQDLVTAARADATRAAADYRRYSVLYKQDAVSRQLLDQSSAAARMAQANLDAAQARVASAREHVAEMRSNAAVLAKAVTQAQSQADEARNRVAQAQGQAEQARAAIGEAQGRLAQANSAPQQVAVSRQAVQSAGADVSLARAQLEQARLHLQYTRVYAPMDGRIAKKSVEPGQVVQVGQNMMALVSTNVWVTANFKETQLAHIHTGDPVDIKVDAYPGETFHGHVDSIQPGSGAAFSILPPENATGNYVKVVQRVPVKIVFDKLPDDVVLGPGMSVVPYVGTK